MRLGKRISPRIVFQPDMLHQEKRDVFLQNTANKHCVIVISNEPKKAGVTRFIHLMLTLILQS